MKKKILFKHQKKNTKIQFSEKENKKKKKFIKKR